MTDKTIQVQEAQPKQVRQIERIPHEAHSSKTPRWDDDKNIKSCQKIL